jgi:hypothetical protein
LDTAPQGGGEMRKAQDVERVPRWRRVRMFWKDPRQAWIEAEIAEFRLEVDRAGDQPGAV